MSLMEWLVSIVIIMDVKMEVYEIIFCGFDKGEIEFRILQKL